MPFGANFMRSQVLDRAGQHSSAHMRRMWTALCLSSVHLLEQPLTLRSHYSNSAETGLNWINLPRCKAVTRISAKERKGLYVVDVI